MVDRWIKKFQMEALPKLVEEFKLEKAQRDIKLGKGVTLHSKSDIQKYFETM